MSAQPYASIAAYPEIIVVLGGGVLPDGTPAPATLARGTAAAELARAHPDAAIVCSGSHGVGRKPRRSEAAAMAGLIVAAGIDRERIFLEDQSRDTIGNAVYVAERYLGAIAPRRVYIVSSPFHLERSVETFRLVLDRAGRSKVLAARPRLTTRNAARTRGGSCSRRASSSPGSLPARSRA